jgi:hypothetical protein
VVAKSFSAGGAVFDCLPGNESATGNQCPPGGVPVRRVSLDDLVKFATLGEFPGKGPPGEGLPPASR